MKYLPIKLVITDIVNEEIEKQFRNVVSGVASAITPHEFGMFHTALIIGLIIIFKFTILWQDLGILNGTQVACVFLESQHHKKF